MKQQDNISATDATDSQAHCFLTKSFDTHHISTCHCVNVYDCDCTAAGPEATFTVTTSFPLVINIIKACLNNSLQRQHQNTSTCMKYYGNVLFDYKVTTWCSNGFHVCITITLNNMKNQKETFSCKHNTEPQKDRTTADQWFSNWYFWGPLVYEYLF